MNETAPSLMTGPFLASYTLTYGSYQACTYGTLTNHNGRAIHLPRPCSLPNIHIKNVMEVRLLRSRNQDQNVQSPLRIHLRHALAPGCELMPYRKEIGPTVMPQQPSSSASSSCMGGPTHALIVVRRSCSMRVRAVNTRNGIRI